MSINYNNEIKERFIPIAYRELLEGCLKYFKKEDDEQYNHFSALLRIYYHQQFHGDMLELDYLYRPFNPDDEMITLHTFTLKEYRKRKAKLFSKIEPLLNHANYNVLTEEMLQETINATSPYGVEVSVDFEDFEDIRLFYRGESMRYEEKRDPWKLYLSKKKVEALAYRRLFLLLKPKELNVRAKEIAKKEGKSFRKVRRQLKRYNPLLIVGESNQSIYIKLFKNIPHSDLKMLFPNSKIKMNLFDKVKLGVLGGSGTIGGGSTLLTKLGAAIDPIAILIALGVFIGVVWRQVKEVIFHRTHYMAELAKKLYFYNLDNNMGALNYMVDMAEDSEGKEALLAYIFLLQSNKAITRQSLDTTIELYIKDTYDIGMDFEIDDGIKKLYDLGLIIEVDGYMHALEIQDAITCLEKNIIAISHLPQS